MRLHTELFGKTRRTIIAIAAMLLSLGVVLAVFVLSVSSVASKTPVRPEICEFWVADPEGLDMNKVIAQRDLGYSLHGVFNIKSEGVTSCLKYDAFCKIWRDFFESGKLRHFIDASPKTEYTCCKHQWNEYLEHGCKANVSYSTWEKKIFHCLNTFDYTKMFVSQCRFDSELGCNHAEQVTDKYVVPADCRKGFPYCFEICTATDSEFNTMCRSGGVTRIGGKYDALVFGHRDVYIDEQRDSFNCHCNGRPHHGLDPWYVKSIRVSDFELTTRSADVTTEAPRVNREMEEPSTEVPGDQIPFEEEKITCACPGMQKDYRERPRGGDFIQQQLHFDYYTMPDVSALEQLSYDFVIVCQTTNGLGTVKPSMNTQQSVDVVRVRSVRRRLEANIRMNIF